MTDEVQVCPECDSTKITPRSGSFGTAEPRTWRCYDCKAVFDEPETRPPECSAGDYTGGLSPGGRTLVNAPPDADLDDLATDGGEPEEIEASDGRPTDLEEVLSEETLAEADACREDEVYQQLDELLQEIEAIDAPDRFRPEIHDLLESAALAIDTARMLRGRTIREDLEGEPVATDGGEDA